MWYYASSIYLFFRTSFFEPQSASPSFIIAPMTQIPTLTQLLKQAIENRLLDVHTALIAKVESYDPAKQQVSVSPVLKRAIKTLDGEIIQEQLPVLSEVPVLFPRAGGFFISFPIQPGDFVQLVFNESSIDEWVADLASDEVYSERFSLQGAVAIPGVFPESKPLSGAHKTNFVAGKDGGVQLHIDGEKIRLGSADASEALAIANRVEAELNKIINIFNLHTHKIGDPPIPLLKSSSSVATSKVVAE